MGTVKHDPYTSSTHPTNSEEMGAPIKQLDKSIVYLNDKLVSCASDVTWEGSTGTLSWAGTITVLFVKEDGVTISNTVAASSKVISDGDFAYITLSETNGTAVTVSTATPTTLSASNFIADSILILGVREGGKFIPVALSGEMVGASTSKTEIFDPSLFYPGVPSDSAVMLFVPITRDCTFAADFSGSYAKAKGTTATAQTVFDIQKSGASVGSITFAASGSTGTFVSSGNAAVSFSAGDDLAIVGPATADVTLANIGITLAGSR